MKTLPFYSVHYKGHRLKRTKDDKCNETDGNCLEFINKYLDIKWNNAMETEAEWKDNKYESHICTP